LITHIQDNGYDLGLATDGDGDRIAIVDDRGEYIPTNQVLLLLYHYLHEVRGERGGVVRNLATTHLLDRLAARLGETCHEVPVGFKWFVDGLGDGSLGFGGEESAGASFLRRDGGPWSTDKDGILLGLLACEITARGGKDVAERYRGLTERFGEPTYARVDAPATPEQKAVLSKLSPEQLSAKELAGEPITAMLTEAPGNGAAIGGLKVTTDNGWFAARPSGTEAIYKIYAESFRGADHLAEIQREAQALVDGLL